MRLRPVTRFGAVALTTLAAAQGLWAQDPDSIVPATPPDSLQPGVEAPAVDSAFYPLPTLSSGVPARIEAGVTVWDREALQGTPALTLRELLARVPDLVPLRYGDYGAPQAVVGPGAAGGRVRVFVDGFEEVPIAGGVVDLSRIALTGIQEVRVERSGGEIRVELTSLTPFDPRPFSRVEAGTGDLDTNLFRGTFLHPRALGGSVGVSLERMDTRGRGGGEPGSRQGVWFRYALHRGDDLALSFDLRTGTTESELDSIPPKIDRTSWVVRGRANLTPALAAEVYTGSTGVSATDDELTPVGGTRRQHGARLSWDRAFGAAAVPPTPIEPTAVVDTAGAAADLAPPDAAGAEAEPPTPVVDTLAADTLAADPAAADTLAADRVATDSLPDSPAPALSLPDTGMAAPEVTGIGGRIWAGLEGRLFSGGDLPSRSLVAEAGVDVDGVGGLAVEWRSDAWADPLRAVTASTQGIRAWTAPRFGVSLFAGWDTGMRGSGRADPRIAIPLPDTTDTIPPVPDTLPAYHLSDRTAVQAGVRIDLGPLDVRGVWHRIEVDSVLPVDLLGARAGTAVPGDRVTGFEVAGRLGLPVLGDGLAVVGSLLQWEAEGLYRPRRRYTGGFDFHDVYKGGNLELWASFQVEGRDGMPLPQLVGEGEDATFARVPFHQSWDAWLQVRVLTVRIFIRSENVTLRGGNQDFPGRLLPQTRSVYGIRWTLWN